MAVILDLLSYDFFRRALVVSVCMSLTGPCVGLFLVLRRGSMSGDVLAHSGLAGAAAGLALGLNPVFSAFALAAGGAVLAELLRGVYARYADLALALVLALATGLSAVLISGGWAGGNVEGFFFGSVVAVSEWDVAVTLGLTALTLGGGWFLLDRLVALAFDPLAARLAGVRTGLIAFLFAALAGATVAVAARVVGALAIGAILVVPVATAMILRRGLRATLLWAVLISLLDSLLGLALSGLVDFAPGGLISLLSVAVLLIVLAVSRLRRWLALEQR